MANMIDRFEGDMYFLSNFYPAEFIYKGVKYLNSEAAFHAQKQPGREHEFANLSPDQAKKLGRSVKLREDWEDVKNDIMYEIVYEKFNQNLDLLKLLIDTGDDYLIEGNWWGDTYWGVCKGIGKNQLGIILMKVRDEFSKTMLNNASYDNVYVFRIDNSKKYRVIIDMTNEESAYDHYIYGVLYNTWKYTCLNSMTLDKFFDNIVWLDVVNINALYNRNCNNLIYFYKFMDEYARFKDEYHIRIGSLYKENADA